MPENETAVIRITAECRAEMRARSEAILGRPPVSDRESLTALLDATGATAMAKLWATVECQKDAVRVAAHIARATRDGAQACYVVGDGDPDDPDWQEPGWWLRWDFRDDEHLGQADPTEVFKACAREGLQLAVTGGVGEN